MSMPYPLAVVTISERNPNGGELALLVSGMLSRMYLTVKAVSSYTQLSSDFFAALKRSNFYLTDNKLMSGLRNIDSVDPNGIHFWLALDSEGEKAVINLYKQMGDFDNKAGFGLPARVAHCGFEIPDLSHDNYGAWLSSISKQLKPWRKLFAKVQSDYS